MYICIHIYRNIEICVCVYMDIELIFLVCVYVYLGAHGHTDESNNHWGLQNGGG